MIGHSRQGAGENLLINMMTEVFGIELGGSQLWAAIDVEGTAPTLDLVLGYLKANTSLPLKFFLSRSGLADRSCVEKVC
jgi:hypothetical protein